MGGSPKPPPMLRHGPVAGPQAERPTVAGSNTEVEQLRNMSNNTLIVAFALFSKDSLRALWLLISGCTENVQEAHSEFLVTQKTRRGCEAWAADMALGHYEPSLVESVAALSDFDLLVEAGLLRFCARSEPFLLSFEEAESIASAAAIFCLHMVGLERTWLLRFSHSPPGAFFALLVPDKQAEALQRLKKHAGVLVRIGGGHGGHTLPTAGAPRPCVA